MKHSHRGFLASRVAGHDGPRHARTLNDGDGILSPTLELGAMNSLERVAVNTRQIERIDDLVATDLQPLAPALLDLGFTAGDQHQVLPR